MASKPEKRTATGTIRRTRRSNSVHTSSDAGPAAAQLPEDVGAGEAGVDDVLHQDHVAAVHVVVEVLHDPHPARALGVGGDAQEVDLAGDRHLACQVGEEGRLPFRTATRSTPPG